MPTYLKIGEWIINPECITSVHNRQNKATDDSTPKVTIYFSGDTHSVSLKNNDAAAFLRWIEVSATDITPV
jgi:hypothetical protein